MNIFKSKRKTLTITQKDPTHKVLYLGNVHTAMMKGEGCVDKPVGVIWKNYLHSPTAGKDMDLTICAFGIKVKTRDQGVTEYRAHRITYCIAHPQYPKLFVWVYRHEGKKFKVDLRCHAVLCKSETKAKALAVTLHEKLSLALRAFMTEKNVKQRARLLMQRTNSLPTNGSAMPMRKKLLSTAGNFKPSVEKSPSAPKLNVIRENTIAEAEEEEELYRQNEADDSCSEANCACMTSLEEEEDFEADMASDTSSGDAVVVPNPAGDDPGSLDDYIKENETVDDLDLLRTRMVDMEIGNDIEELKNDVSVMFSVQNPDSDDADSGFSEQKEIT